MTGLFLFDESVEGDYMSTAGLQNIRKLREDFYLKPIDNLSTFEWQHATADYNKVIHKGVEGLLADIEKSKKIHHDNSYSIEFLTGLETVAKALIDWTEKCSEEVYLFAEKVENIEYKNNLLTLAKTLKKVPLKPAETFYEAVLSIYILFSYDPDSLGILDRTLYGYYVKDIKAGILTREQAKEYLQELFLMLQSRTPVTSDRFTRGGESHFCIGGYLPDGSDGFNELSMLILEAMTELPTYIPQVSLRWTKKLPFETFKKVLDFERNDKNKRIAFVNDDAKISSFMNNDGFSFEDACSYSTVGCNENAFPGGFVGGTSNTNGLRSMQNTFFNRTDDILKAESFAEFFDIYKQELESDLDEMIDYDDKFNVIRAKDVSLVSSLLFDSCIEKADVFTRGVCNLASAGVGIIGIANMIDSLAIVKQFVYDEKIVTMNMLVDALKNNWEGYEDLHAHILKEGKFFGNDDETSNYTAQLLLDTIYFHLKDKRSVWGYHLGIGNLQGYNHHHQIFGSKTKATPDGRFNGDMLKFGVGQNEGKDRSGLTALLNSIAKCDRHGVMSGSTVTNLYLEEQLIKKDDYFEKTARLLETYFQNGGVHFQLNYLSKEDLIKAKMKPQDYKSLRVRVSGFSEYFTRLDGSVQDDVIARTEHSR